MKKRLSLGLLLIYLFFAVLIVCMASPVLMLVTESVSSERAILSGENGILPNPADMHFDSYRMVFRNSSFVTSFINTVSFTVIGTIAALVSTAGYAYALSKPYLCGRKGLLILSIFVMIFSGGLIPTYLVMTQLHLINTFHILWMAGCFSVANMLILKNSFEALPIELEEAAIIDGANQFTILTRIYLPLSKAVLAVIALYYAVDYWNNYYTSMIYTTRPALKSLQLVLKDIIYSASDVFMELYGSGSMGEVTTQSTIAACIVVATLPICIVYPFLQKHFAKGVLVGSVKG